MKKLENYNCDGSSVYTFLSMKFKEKTQAIGYGLFLKGVDCTKIEI